MHIPPKLRDPWRGIQQERFRWQGVSGEFLIGARDCKQALRASVAECVHEEPLVRLIGSQESGNGFLDFSLTAGFGLEEEFVGVYCAEDYAGGGVEAHVGFGVVGDVFWGRVHPGAEEDRCWRLGGGRDGGVCWWGVEADFWGEADEC